MVCTRTGSTTRGRYYDLELRAFTSYLSPACMFDSYGHAKIYEQRINGQDAGDIVDTWIEPVLLTLRMTKQQTEV